MISSLHHSSVCEATDVVFIETLPGNPKREQKYKMDYKKEQESHSDKCYCFFYTTGIKIISW